MMAKAAENDSYKGLRLMADYTFLQTIINKSQNLTSLMYNVHSSVDDKFNYPGKFEKYIKDYQAVVEEIETCYIQNVLNMPTDIRAFVKGYIDELQTFGRYERLYRDKYVIYRIGRNERVPDGDEDYYFRAEKIVFGMNDGKYSLDNLIDNFANPDKKIVVEKKKLLFISHSAKDVKYVTEFADLLRYIGLTENEIVATSVPEYRIPLGNNIYEWLLNKFKDYDLYVLFMLSHNYYDSAASLNEMGATWVLKHKWDAVLLPGFGFQDIKGCIDKNKVALKLDADETKYRLGELKTSIETYFGLKPVSQDGWERHRDVFLERIEALTPEVQESVDMEFDFGDEDEKNV